MSKKDSFSWFKLVFLVIFIYFTYVIAGQQLEIMRINQEERVVNTKLTQVSAENAELTNEKNNLNTLKHIEKIAREHLGMVKPGEVPYIPTIKPSQKP